MQQSRILIFFGFFISDFCVFGFLIFGFWIFWFFGAPLAFNNSQSILISTPSFLLWNWVKMIHHSLIWVRILSVIPNMGWTLAKVFCYSEQHSFIFRRWVKKMPLARISVNVLLEEIGLSRRIFERGYRWSSSEFSKSPIHGTHTQNKKSLMVWGLFRHIFYSLLLCFENTFLFLPLLISFTQVRSVCKPTSPRSTLNMVVSLLLLAFGDFSLINVQFTYLSQTGSWAGKALELLWTW